MPAPIKVGTQPLTVGRSVEAALITFGAVIVLGWPVISIGAMVAAVIVLIKRASAAR